jgi:gliding motility-associated-like protein
MDENTTFELETGNLVIDDPEKQRVFKLTVRDGDNYTLSGAERNVISPLQNYRGQLTVIVTVNDGKNESAPFTVNIMVVPKRERPAIVGQVSLLTDEDTPFTLKIEDFTVTGANPGSYSLIITDGPDYTFDGLTVTPALNKNGPIEVSVQAGIGANISIKFLAQVYVVPVNDRPEIIAMETNPISHEPGSDPVPITETFDCDDVDENKFLNFAEVGLDTVSYKPGNDELIFQNTDSSPIRGVYDASRGVLSLIGYATPEQYEQAIRSVKYHYRLTLDENGEQSEISTEPKSVYVEISDGELASLRRIRPIELETSVDLDIPTAFTPNGDPINSIWAVRPVTNSDQFNKTIIRVYDKRGLMVYESVGFEKGKEWDGTFNGQVLPTDTYYYTIDLNLSFISKIYKGAVTILR